MSADLATLELLDCAGRVSHRLTLEADGTVTITFTASARTARVDPRTRRNLTPQVPVPDALVDQATGLQPW